MGYQTTDGPQVATNENYHIGTETHWLFSCKRRFKIYFHWMKIFPFWFKLHCYVSSRVNNRPLRVQIMARSHYLYQWWSSWLPPFLGLSELKQSVRSRSYSMDWAVAQLDILHDDVIKWKYFPRYWLFVRGIQRSPVNSPHNDQWRRALVFSFICAWIKGWVNNRQAGDLRRHYEIIVMMWR